MKENTSRPPEGPSQDGVIEDILKERGRSYGDFISVSSITETMMGAISGGSNWSNLSPQTKTALFFICNKIARVVEGSVKKDSILDIQGYAELILRTDPSLRGGSK